MRRLKLALGLVKLSCRALCETSVLQVGGLDGRRHRRNGRAGRCEA